MMALSKKWTLLITCFMVMLMQAEEKRATNIGQYYLKQLDMFVTKTFVNDTPKTLLFVWQVGDPHSERMLKKSVPIKSGDSYQLDLSEAVKAFGRKNDKKDTKYAVDLSLGVIKKAPIMLNDEFVWRGLKASEKGLRISQKEHLKNKTFTLYKAKNCKIMHKAVA